MSNVSAYAFSIVHRTWIDTAVTSHVRLPDGDKNIFPVFDLVIGIVITENLANPTGCCRCARTHWQDEARVATIPRRGHVISTHLLRQDVSGVGAHARARVKEYTGNVRITAVLEPNRRHGRSSFATFDFLHPW